MVTEKKNRNPECEKFTRQDALFKGFKKRKYYSKFFQLV